MRSLILLSASLTTIATTALSQPSPGCPHSGNDACEAWQVERMDKELAALIAGPSKWIDRMPENLRSDARAALAESHARWLQFRQAECQRKLTWSYMTARGRDGFLANCALNLTFHRRNDLQKDYGFNEP
jgi:uncharacterized protein YecT (DUF1311 family)